MDLKKLFGEDIANKINEVVKEKNLNVIIDNKEKPEYIPKSRFDELTGNKNQLKTQVGELTNQLEELKKSAKGNEELTKQITEFQNKNTELESKLKETSIAASIKIAALNAKAKDPGDVLAFVDKSKLNINEDGTIVGLDEQLKNLQESKPYLFGEPTPIGAGSNPPGGGGSNNPNMDDLANMSMEDYIKFRKM